MNPESRSFTVHPDMVGRLLRRGIASEVELWLAYARPIPAELTARLTEALSIPLIGIGAGAGCDAQVLVSYDMLGITPGHRPKFSRNFLSGHDSLQAAVEAYVRAVKSGEFPGPEHCIA